MGIMKRVFGFVTVTAMLFALISCKDRIDVSGGDKLYVETLAADGVSIYSATLHGRLTAGYDVENGFTEEIGLRWGHRAKLTKDVQTMDIVVQEGERGFRSNLNALIPDTPFYFRAFAKIDGKYYYGNIESFRTGEVQITGVTLNKTNLNFTLGSGSQEEKLIATVKPDNVSDKTVTWSSSAPTVVTVSKDGLVKVAGEGKSTVTAQAGSYKATCAVTVTKVLPTSITVFPSSQIIRMKDGKTVQLTATVKPDNAADKSVTWSCYESDASVTTNGYVTVKRSGVFKITAQSKANPSVTGECTLTVINVPPSAGVDLGLSVKWAPFNLGATAAAPATGLYFAWGETEPKPTPYNSSTYKYTSAPNVLPTTADAARVNWGGTWRMPTQAEMNDLLTQCTWTWQAQGSKYVVSRNGKSIDIPTGGYYADHYGGDGGGYYWTSTRNTSSGYRDAYYLYFYSSFKEIRGTSPNSSITGFCPCGLLIRPVCN